MPPLSCGRVEWGIPCSVVQYWEVVTCAAVLKSFPCGKKCGQHPTAEQAWSQFVAQVRVQGQLLGHLANVLVTIKRTGRSACHLNPVQAPIRDWLLFYSRWSRYRRARLICTCVPSIRTKWCVRNDPVGLGETVTCTPSSICDHFLLELGNWQFLLECGGFVPCLWVLVVLRLDVFIHAASKKKQQAGHVNKHLSFTFCQWEKNSGRVLYFFYRGCLGTFCAVPHAGLLDCKEA